MPAQGGVVSSAQQQSPDLAVVGGGVIGLSVAWRASQRGLRTVVLERAGIGAGASGVAAGMLAASSEAAFGEQGLLALNLESARRWPAFAAELAERSGEDSGYRRCGTLLAARDADAAAALERELAFRESLGLAIERLLPTRARELEPALAPGLRAAASAPDDHAVDPRRLLVALAAALRAAGGELREGAEVSELDTSGERATGVTLAGGQRLGAGAVVIAAGAWAGGLAGVPDGARVPVRPVKGQLLRLRDHAGPGLLERVLRTEDFYLVPRGDGGYVLGATMEERGFDETVTAGAVHDLLRDAVEVVPGITELEVEEAVAGLRPGTPDNAPAIGPGALEGLHWATGHHRHGVLLAPLTADLVIDGLDGGAVANPDADLVSPVRFDAGARAEVPA
jgi:glycine oxidase